MASSFHTLHGFERCALTGSIRTFASFHDDTQRQIARNACLTIAIRFSIQAGFGLRVGASSARTRSWHDALSAYHFCKSRDWMAKSSILPSQAPTSADGKLSTDNEDSILESCTSPSPSHTPCQELVYHGHHHSYPPRFSIHIICATFRHRQASLHQFFRHQQDQLRGSPHLSRRA